MNGRGHCIEEALALRLNFHHCDRFSAQLRALGHNLLAYTDLERPSIHAIEATWGEMSEQVDTFAHMRFPEMIKATPHPRTCSDGGK